MVEHDLNWALWELSGSYYLREGQFNAKEQFGLLDPKWTHVRNERFLQRITIIQYPRQGNLFFRTTFKYSGLVLPPL